MKNYLPYVALAGALATPALASGRIAFLTSSADSIDLVVADRDGKNLSVVVKGTAPIPNISPDGRYVLYPEPLDKATLKDFAVVTRDLKTGLIEQWTPHAGWNLHTTFNHSGSIVAYSSPVPGEKRSRIAYFSIDHQRRHAEKRPISTGEGVGIFYKFTPDFVESEHSLFAPFFSSDGSRLVYQVTVNPDVKYIAERDVASGKSRAVTDETGRCEVPTYSFDNQKISYTCLRDGNWDVYVYDRLAQKEVRVTNDAARDQTASFSPEGDLVFASNRSGKFAIYRASAASLAKGAPEVDLFLEHEHDAFYVSFSGDVSATQETLASIPAPGRSSFGAVRLDDRVYIVGGHQGPEHHYPRESFLDRTDYYDLTTGEWHEVAPRAVPSQGFEVAAHGGYIYAFGGFAFNPDASPNWRSLDEIERYDPETNEWKVIGKMPHRRSSYVMEVVDGKAYLLGGWDATPKAKGDAEGTFLDAVDVFDFETETMTTLEGVKLPLVRRAFSSVEHDGKILLLGGLGQGATHFELLDLVTEFDPATGSFRELEPLPFATFAPAAGILGGKLHVFGGMFRLGQWDFEYVDHVFARDLAGGEWSHVGRYLSEAKGFPLVVDLGDNRLGILGGHHYYVDEKGEPADAPVRTFETFGYQK